MIVDGKHVCNFCGKTEGEARLMVAGPNNADICDECIELARDIIGAERYNKVMHADRYFTKGREDERGS